MKLGDIVESAVWITGDESPLIRQQYEHDVQCAIANLCMQEGFEHGPITFTEKRPGEDKVPVAPDHIQGSCVRLLVAHAEIYARRPQTSEGSFVANLDKNDLERLRAITRRIWAKQNHGGLDSLTDRQCDDYIELIGPETAVDMIRAQHHTLQ